MSVTDLVRHLVAAASAACIAAAATSCDGDDAPPDACEGSDPLDSADCGRALDARCREQTTQTDCEGQGPFLLERKIEYACSWARRVMLDDAAACTLQVPTNVCVAIGKDPNFTCADGCSDTGFFNTLMASTTQDEILLHRCPADGAFIFGVIDETVLVEDDSFSYLACNPSVTPPPPPACACREQVCDALEVQ